MGLPSNTNENELVRGKNILKCVQMGPERHESYSYQAQPDQENCNSNSSEGVLESVDHLTFLAFEFKTLLSCSSVTHNGQFQSKIFGLQQNSHSNISEEDG